MAVSLLTSATVTPSLNINTQTGTTYTTVLGDGNNTLVTLNNASSIAVTIPTNASVAYPVGTILNFSSLGAGIATISGASGVTIVSTGATAASPQIRAKYSSATAIQTSANNWIVAGDIS